MTFHTLSIIVKFATAQVAAPSPGIRLVELAFCLLCYNVSGQQISVTSCGADSSGKSDSTASFQKCLKLLPAGDLMVPYGTYRIAGSVYKNRNQNLIGMGSKGSTLKCEAIDTPCIVAADTSGGPNNYNVSVIQNLGIEGPGIDNQSIGVLIGGDPQSKIISKNAFGDGVSLINLRITNFNHGVEWGNNGFGNKLFLCSIFQNATGLFVPEGLQNSGEGIGITDSGIFNNRKYGIEDHTNFEWMIQGTSFDYNNTAVMFYGATIHAVNCHFEQPSAEVFFQPYGMATLSIRDSEILVQASTGTEKYILDTWPQYLNLTIDDVSIWSNHPVKYFMHVGGITAGTIVNLYGNGNRKIGALSDVASHAVLSAIQAF